MHSREFLILATESLVNLHGHDDVLSVKLSRSLRCCTPLTQTTDNNSIMSLMFTLPWTRRINPGHYRAFEGNGVDILILDLCLNAWDELSASEW